MISLKSVEYFVFAVLVGLAVSGCGGQQKIPQTLGDIDVSSKQEKVTKSEEPKRSKAEIKKAYYDFLTDAAEDDEFRLLATTRIAEIELEDGGAASIDDDDLSSEAVFESTVHNTIKLLNKALKDFPNAPGNDHTLYQLAKAYGQVGEVERADATLKKMVTLYPDTPYYLEAKFRIAEAAFIHQDYLAAEDAYSDVLRANDNQNFLEKSLFKRGWSRFKQELYEDALVDYYGAIKAHKFAPEIDLNDSEKQLFEEYFRAVGLAFAYLGGAPAIEDYFSQNPSAPYTYRTYNVVSNLLLKQERYSDAVETLETYIRLNPRGEGLVSAQLDIVNIWKDAKFFNRYVEAFETLYLKYHSDARVWKFDHRISTTEKSNLVTTIRSNAVRLASYYHNRYNKKPNSDDWQMASQWYERYLAGYQVYARKDKIYPLYAELLNKGKRYEQAFTYYELSAFDGGIVLDKESAYATVYLSDRLYQVAEPTQKEKWLEKHLSYAYLYAQLYPNEAHTPKVVEHAVQLAFKDNQLQRTVEIANILPDQSDAKIHHEVGLLKAQAYFNQEFYEDAEVMYQDLLVDRNISNKKRADLSDKLALSIYKQAEFVQATGEEILAAEQFLRVYQIVPQSELAPTAVYDAIALFMSGNRWGDAINYLNLFKREFPKHPYQSEVGKKLSVAYLKADRGLEAAREFEKLSDFVTNQEEKMAALWQAAELYQKKGDLQSALRAYKEYAHTYKRPFDTSMEAMNNIANIYQKQSEKDKRIFWFNKIQQADKKEPKSNKTERTEYIAASVSFAMATMRYDDFERVRLIHPLAKSLKRKKSAMQEAVKFYGQATIYGHEDFVTQSTHNIGNIYKHFAKALLDSERPRNLTADELEQYNILLEDQAFPFEDKAIEFYETNVSRIGGGTYDNWVEQSIAELAVIFPARYGRSGKVEMFIEQLQ